MISFPFNPVDRAATIEDLVMRNHERKYYRFRASRHYGGIVTADAVGCCFLCAYCWNYRRNEYPEEHGSFYSPDEVIRRLQAIAGKRKYTLYRVSGAEPVLGERSFAHLIDVTAAGTFVIETNGFLLGYRPDLVRELAGRDVLVRVSLKGWDEASFEAITGAEGRYVLYPLLALKHLQETGIRAWPAVMADVFGKEGIRVVGMRLAELGVTGRIEQEYCVRYPFVLANLMRRGIRL